MAKIHGVAGEWARVKGTVLGLWPLFLGVFASGVSAGFALLMPRTAAVMFVIALAFMAWRLMAGMRRIERFYKGARGEEKVSEILACLPDGYHVFNNFDAGRYHVDHVVVGPGGVFALETKFWRGRVTVEDGHVLLDGQLPDRAPLAQVAKEATAVKNALAKAGWTGMVSPVLVFASDTFVAHRANVMGTTIINSDEIKASFASDRVVLSAPEVERLAGLMDTII